MGWNIGYNVCTDVFGNVYVTGYFDYTVSFGSYTLISPGNPAIFLVKYDLSGNVLWAKSAGGTLNDGGLGVSTDRLGNVYITGFFYSPTITFGAYTLTNAGNENIFIAKYDSSGNVKWAKNAGGSGNDVGFSIATDARANVYITGYFSSPAITFGSYTINNSGIDNIFLVKYDSSGNVMWAKRAGGTGDDRGYYVAADSSGNAYLTGYYTSISIAFGSYTLVRSGGYDAFLAKYDSSGNVRWAKSIGGKGYERGYCVATDKSYRIYITGAFNSDTLTFDTITVLRPAVYSGPMYVAGYDSAGHISFAKALASGGENSNSVASSPSGCIYIAGDFQVVDPFVLGNDSLHPSGAGDVFVAKLCYSDSSIGINEISATQEFILYPNPFEDKLNVTITPHPLKGESAISPLGGGGENEIILYDITSRVLLRRSFINQATINTEQLARGMYFYEVRDKDGVGARGKAVKQ
jgi:hypothetical protein